MKSGVDMFSHTKKTASISPSVLTAIYCHTRPSTSIIALSSPFLNVSWVFKIMVSFKYSILELAKLWKRLSSRKSHSIYNMGSAQVYRYMDENTFMRTGASPTDQNNGIKLSHISLWCGKSQRSFQTIIVNYKTHMFPFLFHSITIR